MNENILYAKLEEEIINCTQEATFSVTNESLDAIIGGLDLQPTDSVLAIAGSGDQAFAMLEYAKQVLVVDKSQKQINLVNARIKALRARMYDLFLTKLKIVSPTAKLPAIRNNYFLKEGRLEKIRENLENLVILPPTRILEISDVEVSKMYLSNVVGNHFVETKIEELSELIKNLHVGGIVYFTNSYAWIKKENESIRLYDCKIPDLSMDAKLTEKARDCEKSDEAYVWRPIVFRKVECAE